MEDESVWLLAFCQIVSIQFHPANNMLYKEDIHEDTLMQCSKLADSILNIHRIKFPKEETCHCGLQEEQ